MEGQSNYVEWNDQDISQEKFTLKYQYEDPDKINLPPSLEKMSLEQKRISEFIKVESEKDFVGVANPTILSDYFSPTSRISVEGEATGYTKFVEANIHILNYGSSFSRDLLHFFHVAYESDKHSCESIMPYQLIYPKSKDGLPMYNSSGKYLVKLFFMGSWRKITIDDKIPLDVNGKPLLISSLQSNEIWPLLINKAILKIANLFFNSKDISNEYEDFNIFEALTGWLPERFDMCTFKEKVSVKYFQDILALSTTVSQSTSKLATKQTDPEKNKDSHVIIIAYPNINNTFIIDSKLTFWPVRLLDDLTSEKTNDPQLKLVCYYGVNDLHKLFNYSTTSIDSILIPVSKFINSFEKIIVLHNPVVYKYRLFMKSTDIFKNSYILCINR